MKLIYFCFRFTHNLVRDTSILSVVTLSVLVLSGLLGVAVQHMVNSSGYKYVPSSFGKTTK